MFLTVAIGKKLKRRLEDLERRAGSSDDASSPTGSEKQSPTASRNTKKTSSSKTQKSAAPQKPVQPPQFTPPMTNDDEALFAHGYDPRERSHTPPSYIGYSTYPPPDEMILAPYGSTQTYHHPMTTAEGYSNYMATTVPCTLPSMTHFNDAIKREAYPAEESVPPYMSYGYVSGLDVNASNSYDQSNPHVSHVRAYPRRDPRS